jgi:hypothetical protein
MKPVDLEPLKELLERFKLVCQDMDGNTDPADIERIRRAEKALAALARVRKTDK